MSDDNENVIEMNEFLSASVNRPNNCKRCGEPYVPTVLVGRTMYFPNCDCNDIIAKEAEEERIRIEEEMRIEEQKALASKNRRLMIERMHVKYRNIIYANETDMSRIPPAVLSYLSSVRSGGVPHNVIIMGVSYSGKTFAVHYMFSEIGDPDFCCETPQEIFSNICDKKRSLAWYVSVRWLCIDDIDKVTNEYIKMALFDILDGRSKRGYPTWATGNQDEKTLARNIGEPSKNRLFENALIVVMAKGK